MKKAMFLTLLLAWAVFCSCSMEAMGHRQGIAVLFEGTPQIFDLSVQYQGMTVGKVVAHDWANGITRIVIDFDSQYDGLMKNNLAIVAKAGRLNVVPMSGYGDLLPKDACINGFVNTTSYRWFKFKHLIDNINFSADRRARDLLARSGLSG